MPNKLARAFTLIELLVVIAIIAILAAILFPVFAQAKQAAKKTAAISDMKQGSLAAQMYLNDYDDSYVLADTGSIGGPGWGFGPPDTVPFQVMQPYVKNWGITIDPMDPVQSQNQRVTDQCLSISTMGCTSAANATPTEAAYSLGVRANMGYNFAFFSPWIVQIQPTGVYVGSASLNASQVTQPAHTLMFGTSIWNRVNGAPTGGGNWVVQTPCWNNAQGQLLPPASQYQSFTGAGQAENYGTGWNSNGEAPAVYGFMWPFYNQTSSDLVAAAQNGQVVIGWADGHTKAMPISQVAAGCSAYGDTSQLAPQGNVTDPSKFIWATEQ